MDRRRGFTLIELLVVIAVITRIMLSVVRTCINGALSGTWFWRIIISTSSAGTIWTSG
ncbi:MAG: prepilin-type N-terminal cleavage/methylation domain-containing protein [Planctomycetota bacterium]